MTRIRETRPIREGFAQTRREARVRELAEGEAKPEGAEEVDAKTQVSEWAEVVPETLTGAQKAEGK